MLSASPSCHDACFQNSYSDGNLFLKVTPKSIKAEAAAVRLTNFPAERPTLEQNLRMPGRAMNGLFEVTVQPTAEVSKCKSCPSRIPMTSELKAIIRQMLHGMVNVCQRRCDRLGRGQAMEIAGFRELLKVPGAEILVMERDNGL